MLRASVCGTLDLIIMTYEWAYAHILSIFKCAKVRPCPHCPRFHCAPRSKRLEASGAPIDYTT